MSDENVITLTERELNDIIRKTVDETLLGIGIDHENPIEMQKDFQHLRDWRNTMNSVRQKSIVSVIGFIATGFIAAAWLGIRAYLSNPGP